MREQDIEPKTRKKEPWPHWLPKSTRRQVELTKEQYNFILPIYAPVNHKRVYDVDGISLSVELRGANLHYYAFGISTAFKTWLRRFAFSDIDLSNIKNKI